MVIKTKTLNEKLNKNSIEFIEQSENAVLSQIKKTAEGLIDEFDTKPVILIAGPSGSSKTTTAIKLSQVISDMGKNVCYISMDKYFKNFSDSERQLVKEGKLDLESPERVDIDVLRSDIDTLVNGGTIFEPRYDFASNVRTRTDKAITLRNGFVIIEGIHALNDTLFGDNDDSTSRIYVSVRTRVEDSNGDRLHPCKIRMLRRMMRDRAYRGRSLEETVRLFPEVQRGENKYIAPYKSRADYNIDTFIGYEPNLYKYFLFDDLCALSEKYADVKDIVSAFDETEAMPPDSVPKDAFVREFIGGSSLMY